MRIISYTIYANNKSTDDEPAHLCSLISAFVDRCLESINSKVAVYTKPSLLEAGETEQAVLNLTWSRTLEDRFSGNVPGADPGFWDKEFLFAKGGLIWSIYQTFLEITQGNAIM